MNIGIELNHRSSCLYDIDFIIKKLITNPKEVVDIVENYSNTKFMNNKHILYDFSKNININQYCQSLVDKINQIKDN